MKKSIVTGACGSVVDFADIKSSEIKLEDIALRLSRIMRFNGGTFSPFSVAQHSYAMSRIAAHKKLSHRVRLLCLLHDATEAFMGDMVSPLKHHFPLFTVMEEQLHCRVEECLGTPHFTQEEWNEVKKIDIIMRACEWHLLNGMFGMIDPTGAWADIYGEDFEPPSLYADTINRVRVWDNRLTEQMFLDAFSHLLSIVKEDENGKST